MGSSPILLLIALLCLVNPGSSIWANFGQGPSELFGALSCNNQKAEVNVEGQEHGQDTPRPESEPLGLGRRGKGSS